MKIYARQLGVLGAFGLLGVWVLYYWSVILIAMWHNYMPLPIWDYWITVMHLPQYEKFQFSVVLPQHNEHRIIFPELVWAVDYLCFRGRQILPIALNFLCHLATLFLFIRAFIAIPRLPRKIAIGGVLLCGILMGWRGLAFLLSASLSLQWTLFEIFSALAFWQIAGLRHARRPWFTLALVSACAVLAEFSSSQGLAIWPILTLAAFWLRMGRREIMALAAVGAFFTALFFVGYQKAPSDLNILIHHFGFWAQFVGCYLGLPFSLVNNGYGIAMGWLSLVLLSFLVWRLRCDDVRGERAGVLYMGFAIFTVVTGLLISLGRLDLNDTGFDSAKPGRYLLIPVLYWTSLFLTSIWLLTLHRRGEFRGALAIAGIAILLLGSLPKAGVADGVVYRRLQEASLSVEAGLEDEKLIDDNIYPGIYWPHILIPLLRTQRMSIFADDRYLWMGRTSSVKRDDREIPGSIELQKSVTGGLEVVGSISPAYEGKDLVFLDSSNRVVGLGEIPRAGLPASFRNTVPSQMTGWIGFVNFSYGRAVSVWAFNRDRTALRPVAALNAGP